MSRVLVLAVPALAVTPTTKACTLRLLVLLSVSDGRAKPATGWAAFEVMKLIESSAPGALMFRRYSPGRNTLSGSPSPSTSTSALLPCERARLAPKPTPTLTFLVPPVPTPT